MKMMATISTESGYRAGLVLNLLVALIVASGTPSRAQETKPAGATILDAAFAAQLADQKLDWPTTEGITRAESRVTRSARLDACLWQEVVLSKALIATSYVKGDKGESFTSGATPGEYDRVCYRWETERYHLQFTCTRGMMFIMAEPNLPRERPKLSESDVRRHTVAALAELVRRGPQLVAHSTMKLEAKSYGYLIRFEQTASQSDALDRDKTNRFLGPSEDVEATELSDEWLTHMTVRTDGYSFVFDVPKMGLGPLMCPSPEKSWFEPRQPPDPNTP